MRSICDYDISVHDPCIILCTKNDNTLLGENILVIAREKQTQIYCTYVLACLSRLPFFKEPLFS